MSAHDATIFVQGILFRSGTNYLARLLEQHPDCVLSEIPEDWVLSESDHLLRYVRRVGGRWRWVAEWGLGDETEEDLLRALGTALVSFLRKRSGAAAGRRLVTKTPDVRALPNFARLFPEARMLILIRDGRSVVESSVRSFGYRADQVARWWAEAAERVLAFERTQRGAADHYRLVRYEDLVREPEKEVAEILRFLDLDPSVYDFAAIRRLPVYGSSTARSESGAWTWTVRPPDDEALGAIERFRDWSRAQHERFEWIAGEPLRRLGYEPIRFDDDPLRSRLARRLWAAEDSARRYRARIAARLAGGG